MTADAPDLRRFAPSTARNREAILAVLKPQLPLSGLVLEVASGAGEHTAFFATACSPNLQFQPTDPDAASHASIDAWASALGLSNVRSALLLDASAQTWPIESADAVICINMIHISPWSATVGLIQGAGRVLPPGGLLYLYGPYRRQGQHTAMSNAAFDADLRSRNAEWGVRDLDAVAEVAAAHGFGAPLVEPMPANNLSVMFRRRLATVSNSA
jgi:SAM-dependent methyltransferase